MTLKRLLPAVALVAALAWVGPPGGGRPPGGPGGGGAPPTLPTQPLPTVPEVDVEHRLLLAAAGRGGDPHELVERALLLTARVLEGADPPRAAAGRPESTRRRRARVD